MGKTFDKLKILTFKNSGNGSIVENVELALKKIDGDLLVAIDYDKGGIMLNQLCKSKIIDLNRLYFIPYESFEEVICNSEFILDKFPNLKDKIIKYVLYMTPNHRSTGKYFGWILHTYIKQKPPIETKRGVTKFYYKGMKHFEECFIKDCCSFNKNDCKLKYDGDKRQAMLSNKFKDYRVFLTDNEE